MITSKQMYWLLMLDNIGTFLGVSFIVWIILFVISGVVVAIGINENDWSKKLVIFPISVFIIASLILIIGTFLPNTKQMAVILVAPRIINNEQVQKLPNQVLELTNEWLEELKPKGVEAI
jgi:apolipoprotein N-acyltransferase